MSVTIQELARRLGVSSATVSMALNGRPGVNAETRKRVQALARELGYQGGRERENGGNRKSLCFFVYQRYGRVVADTQFFSQLIEAVEHTARNMGYGLSLLYCQGREELESALNSVEFSGAKGLLLLATELTEEDLGPFFSLPFPVVLLDCDLRGTQADSVLIDNRDGVANAVEALAGMGHRRIGYLQSSFPIRNFEQRQQGYCEGIQRYGISPQIFLLGPTLEEAFQDMGRLLQEGIFLPTAFIAANDLIALGAMRALKKQGLRVPQQISLVGFDDVPLCRLSDPELSSIAVDRVALGAMGVERLVQRIEGDVGPGVKMVLRTRLVLRQSTAPFPG